LRSWLQVLSDAAVLKRQAREIEELRRRLGNAGCALTPLLFVHVSVSDKE